MQHKSLSVNVCVYFCIMIVLIKCLRILHVNLGIHWPFLDIPLDKAGIGVRCATDLWRTAISEFGMPAYFGY